MLMIETKAIGPLQDTCCRPKLTTEWVRFSTVGTMERARERIETLLSLGYGEDEIRVRAIGFNGEVCEYKISDFKPKKGDYKG